jgi:hypothetical protein
VQTPTIWCRILLVRSSATAPGSRWAVTVADRQGVTATVDLEAEDLQTYEHFQTALLRETGSPFRYLPVHPQAAPRQAPPVPEPDLAAATREKSAQTQECRPGGDSDEGDVSPDHAYGIDTRLPKPATHGPLRPFHPPRA